MRRSAEQEGLVVRDAPGARVRHVSDREVIEIPRRVLLEGLAVRLTAERIDTGAERLRTPDAPSRAARVR